MMMMMMMMSTIIKIYDIRFLFSEFWSLLLGVTVKCNGGKILASKRLAAKAN